MTYLYFTFSVNQPCHTIVGCNLRHQQLQKNNI